MADFLTVLTSRGPLLAKRWTATGIVGYDRAKNFSAHAEPVNDIHDLARVLGELEQHPTRCVIRGRLATGDEATDATTRDLDHFEETPHHWVCIDVDNFEPKGCDPVAEPAKAIFYFIGTQLPVEFRAVSCYWQLSNSAGAPGNEGVLKAHIWFWLDQPRTGPELTAWARQLKLPIDVTVFRTVQVHYTAAPVIEDGASCPVVQRHGFHEGLLGDDVPLNMPDLLDMPIVERAGRHDLVDPREKPGLIGAFCRAYDIRRVIDEVLPDIFEYEGDSDVRLTWSQGGGAPGGACITDDELRIYNSHNTDPFEGRAQNAWDLVRFYRYGHLDATLDEDALDWMGPSGRPSHQAMVAWVRTLEDVMADVREEAEIKAEHERQAHLAHVDALRQGVLACADVEALKAYVRDTLAPDKTIDDADRNGTLTMAVQARFNQLGSPQPRADVRKMLRPPVTFAGSAGPAWLAPWVYVTGSDTFFNTATKATVTPRGFDVLHSTDMPMSQDGVHRERASDFAVNVWSIAAVDEVLYAPGQDPVFEMLGRRWANQFDPRSMPEASGDPAASAAVQLTLRHLERLFPDARERELLISWLACQVQRTGAKVRWAPYVFGAPGAGKTFLAELLGLVLGPQNVNVLSGSALLSPFNGWATGSVVTVIEEVYQAGHLFETEEKLKAPIANNTINVHRKGVDSYPAPNFTNYLLLSNHPDGMPVRQGDRRFFFLHAAVTAQQAQSLAEEGYFDSLFDACRASPGELRAWLLGYAFHPEFDPEGRAPDTVVKQQIIEMSKSDTELDLEELLRGRNAVAPDYLRQRLQDKGHEKVSSRAISKALGGVGFEFVKVMRVSGALRRVYVRPEAGLKTDLQMREELRWCYEIAEGEE